MGRRFEEFEQSTVQTFEPPREATVGGWVIILFLLVVASVLWFYAAPVYLYHWLAPERLATLEHGTVVRGDGTVPGRRAGELAVIIFDLGFGQGIIFQSSGNRTVLVDGGEGRMPDNQEVRAYDWAYRLYLPLFQRIGLEKIDKLVNLTALSHYAGVYPDLVGDPRIELGKIYLSGYQSHTYSFRRLQVEAEERELEINRLKEFQSLDFGPGVKAKIIYGDRRQRHPGDASHVLLVKYGEHSLLITGGLQKEGERELVLKWGTALEADFLVVGDQGSEKASSREFLEYVNPTYAVLASTADGPLELPSLEVLQRLREVGVAKLLRTDIEGHIGLFFDGETVRVNKDPLPFLSF